MTSEPQAYPTSAQTASPPPPPPVPPRGWSPPPTQPPGGPPAGPPPFPPGHGAPQAHWQWPAAGPPRTNSFAVAGFICSLLFFTGFGTPAGIVLGIIGIVQTNRTEQRGRGLAVAAVVIGIATIVLETVLFFLLFYLWARADEYSATTAAAL